MLPVTNTKIKTCPQCGQVFTCYKDDISRCFCSSFQLTEAQLSFVKNNFTNCLCMACLKKVQENKLFNHQV